VKALPPLPLCPVLASTATQYVVDGHDTDTRPLPGSMLVAADQVPPAPDGLELDGLEVGELLEVLDNTTGLPLLEQAVATVPASMLAMTATANRRRATYREPRTLLIMLGPSGVCFGYRGLWRTRSMLTNSEIVSFMVPPLSMLDPVGARGTDRDRLSPFHPTKRYPVSALNQRFTPAKTPASGPRHHATPSRAPVLSCHRAD